MMKTETTAEMTEAQALNEAVLRFTRKARRLLSTEDFSKIWSQLPAGAQTAIYAAERAADAHRDQVGGAGELVWPAEEDLDDETEADAA